MRPATEASLLFLYFWLVCWCYCCWIFYIDDRCVSVARATQMGTSAAAFQSLADMATLLLCWRNRWIATVRPAAEAYCAGVVRAMVTDNNGALCCCRRCCTVISINGCCCRLIFLYRWLMCWRNFFLIFSIDDRCVGVTRATEMVPSSAAFQSLADMATLLPCWRNR